MGRAGVKPHPQPEGRENAPPGARAAGGPEGRPSPASREGARALGPPSRSRRARGWRPTPPSSWRPAWGRGPTAVRSPRGRSRVGAVEPPPLPAPLNATPRTGEAWTPARRAVVGTGGTGRRVRRGASVGAVGPTSRAPRPPGASRAWGEGRRSPRGPGGKSPRFGGVPSGASLGPWRRPGRRRGASRRKRSPCPGGVDQGWKARKGPRTRERGDASRARLRPGGSLLFPPRLGRGGEGGDVRARAGRGRGEGAR